MPTIASWRFARFLLLILVVAAASAQAQERKQLAPGFTARSAESRLLILPADMELYSMSAGGVVEPRDDWTVAAQKHFAEALAAQRQILGSRFTQMSLADADDFADIVTLHRAVA